MQTNNQLVFMHFSFTCRPLCTHIIADAILKKKNQSKLEINNYIVCVSKATFEAGKGIHIIYRVECNASAGS